jgi:hypothetical protein
LPASVSFCGALRHSKLLKLAAFRIPDSAVGACGNKTSEDRALLEFLASNSAVGRTVVAPPDVPAERISKLRSAFNATVADPEFLADAGKVGAEIAPLPADELKKIMAGTLNTSATVLARARADR